MLEQGGPPDVVGRGHDGKHSQYPFSRQRHFVLELGRMRLLGLVKLEACTNTFNTHNGPTSAVEHSMGPTRAFKTQDLPLEVPP